MIIIGIFLSFLAISPQLMEHRNTDHLADLDGIAYPEEDSFEEDDDVALASEETFISYIS